MPADTCLCSPVPACARPCPLMPACARPCPPAPACACLCLPVPVCAHLHLPVPTCARLYPPVPTCAHLNPGPLRACLSKTASVGSAALTLGMQSWGVWEQRSAEAWESESCRLVPEGGACVCAGGGGHRCYRVSTRLLCPQLTPTKCLLLGQCGSRCFLLSAPCLLPRLPDTTSAPRVSWGAGLSSLPSSPLAPQPWHSRSPGTRQDARWEGIYGEE